MALDRPGGPLSGLRVIEMGHFVAAPFGTRLLADLGAEVIKVETPGTGDPARQWGEMRNGSSLWWSMHGRNKLSITLDLKHEKAREIMLGLVAQSDAVIENFRPGQLARWGLGPEVLRAAREDLIIAHISGYGQDGPYRDRPAFGVIGEAIGGLRYLTNKADPEGEPPVRVGVSIGDSISGIYAAFGVVCALWGRDRNNGGDGKGRTIDVALTESVLSLMEGMLPEYGALGKVKQPTGAGIATAAPSNAYPTVDGKWVLIAGNSEPIFRRLAALIGRPEIADAPEYRDNPSRVRNAAALDAMIGAWSRNLPANELMEALDGAQIPNSKIYTAADCASDPQFRTRGMVQSVNDPLQGEILQAGIVPHVPDDPGSIRWAGPALGEHTEQVLRERLSMTQEEIDGLRTQGVI